MNKCLLLLVAVLAIFVGGDSVSASAARPNIETSELSPSSVGHVILTDNGGKRSLRGLALTDDAVNEERGVTELANKFKTWASKSKLGQKSQSWLRKRSEVKAAKKMRLAKLLVDHDVDYKIFYKNKITPQEYYDAKGFHPRLIHVDRTENIFKNNPGFEKYLGYVEYWNTKALKKTV